MKRNQLTVAGIRKLTKPGRYQDGGGLMVYVSPTGGRSWVQRLVIRGVRRDMGLGSLDFVSLAEARARAFENRKIARQGGDPRTPDRPPVPTFAEGLDAVIALKRPTWRNPKVEPQWRASLRDYATPLMPKPVDEITSADVLAVVGPTWSDKRETARRVKGRIGEVMKWSIAQGHREGNPVETVTAALPSNGVKREHFRALPYAAVSGALATIAATDAHPSTKLAFRFLVLTAARSGEVRGARWSEVDLDAAVWTVPGARIKTGREHRVPLSDAALDVLREAAAYRDRSGLIFPSATGLTMSDSTLSKLARENGIQATPHGFRSSFRQWAAERTNVPREVCEFALAHVVGDAAERAYQRSDLFERRRDLMNAWAAYLAAERATVRRIA